MLLRLRKVSCGYRSRTVLAGVNFELGEGEIVGVVGENAVGKTTLLRGLFGAEAWIRGRIEWTGRKVAHLRCASIPPNEVAWVRQDRPVFPGLTVQQALCVVQISHNGCGPNADTTNLALLPLPEELLDRRMEVLSGGERALVSLALGLTNHPRLIVLDEPAANVSSAALDIMIAGLKTYSTQLGGTCLVVEHRLPVLERLGSRIIDASDFSPGNLSLSGLCSLGTTLPGLPPVENTDG